MQTMTVNDILQNISVLPPEDQYSSRSHTSVIEPAEMRVGTPPGRSRVPIMTQIVKMNPSCLQNLHMRIVNMTIFEKEVYYDCNH
jgi:hypothetical protein